MPDRLKSRKLWVTLLSIAPLLTGVLAPGYEADVAAVIANVEAGLATDGAAVDVETVRALALEIVNAETWWAGAKQIAMVIGLAVAAGLYVLGQSKVDAAAEGAVAP